MGDDTVREIADLLRDIRDLQAHPERRDAVMACKRALIERIEPGFYSEPN